MKNDAPKWEKERRKWRQSFLTDRREKLRKSLQAAGYSEEDARKIVHHANESMKIGFSAGLMCADAIPRDDTP